MKKNLFLCLLFTVLILSLMGCQSASSNLNSAGELTKVSVYHAEGFGENSSGSFVATYESENHQEELALFHRLPIEAVEQEGIADIEKPHFNVEMHHENGEFEVFHLWIGGQGHKSSLMNVTNTHTVYFLSAELTSELITVLQQE